MNSQIASKPSRPRGRPRKQKGSLNPKPPVVTGALASPPDDPGAQIRQDSPLICLEDPEIVNSDVPTATPTSSKRSSPDGDEYLPHHRLRRPNSSTNIQTAPTKPPSSNTSTVVVHSNMEHKAKDVILPVRRSTRSATVQSTQISEGTLRPSGPPHLEAALNIALRNLESETWRYLWTHRKRHPSGPLPTPAVIKGSCPLVRAAAEAVDIADRELESAIDEIMASNAKKKGRNIRLVRSGGATSENVEGLEFDSATVKSRSMLDSAVSDATVAAGPNTTLATVDRAV